ncbi:MAG: hypothetical protein MJA30_13490, partial [Cytophagales bacterium]|nr:hypothetical protein [Cytophagales bacterium]
VNNHWEKLKNSLDTNHKKLLAFYQDCYEADTRTISLSNIFSSKVENRHFFQGKDELLGELLPRIPLETQNWRKFVTCAFL